MFNHILVPLDGSELAECVLPHLAAIAEAKDTQVTLIRVMELEGDKQPVDPLEWRFKKAEVESYLERITEKLSQQGNLQQVNAILLEGQPAERVIEYARKNGVDLILLSSHGKSGVSRWNVSSVVRKIIQNANLSTMIIRAYNPGKADINELHYQHILVPLDGSLRAEVVLTLAASIAQEQNATLVLAHVIHKPEIIQRVPLTNQEQDLLNQVIEHSRDAAEQYMNQLQNRLPVPFKRELRVSNNVPHAIQQIAAEQEIDLIILSAHGHSGDPERAYGNVTVSFIEYGSVPMIALQDLTPEEVEPTKAEEAAQEHRGHG